MDPQELPVDNSAQAWKQSASLTQRHLSPHSFSRLRRLCQKELREILRDRRTIITLVLMPLIVYPILSIIFQRFLLTANTTEVGLAELRIGVDSEADAETLTKYLSLGHQLLLRDVQNTSPDSTDIAAATAAESVTEESKSVVWELVDDVGRSLADAKIDLGIRVKNIGQPTANTAIAPVSFELIHQPNSTNSQRLLYFVESRLRAVNDEFVREQLAALGGTSELPVEMVQRSTAKPSTFVSLATLIPLILILMTITGAVYPAIDLTAGERERGTLEALISAPISRMHVLLAKYVAVVTVALLTAAANLIAMSVTLYSTSLGEKIFGTDVFSIKVLFGIFALLVLFAMFFSAVLLSVTSFARSFKEAQAYLIPLMLISLVPGLVSLLPGVEFSGLLSVLPLVNIVLLARDLFEGVVEPAPAAAAIISTALYAASAIAVAAKIFGTDAVLYGSQASWSDWFQRPEETRPCANLSGALLFLAVLFPLYILLANLLTRMGDASLEVRLGTASVITILLFGVLPIGLSLAVRIRVAEAFYLRSASGMAFMAAGLLGVSLWPLVHEVFLLHRSLGLVSLKPEQIAAVKEMIENWQGTSPLVIILTLAIIPAVFEELFFRGFLFSALINKTTVRRAILISAVLFGVFHVVVTSALALERFVPSTCMGIVLGWVCSCGTGSILPGMLLHACHNGLLVTVGYYQDWLTSHNVGSQEQIHLPAYWIGFAVIGTIAGLLVLRSLASLGPPKAAWDSA